MNLPMRFARNFNLNVLDSATGIRSLFEDIFIMPSDELKMQKIQIIFQIFKFVYLGVL